MQKSIFISDNNRDKSAELNALLSEGYRIVNSFKFEETEGVLVCYGGWLIVLENAV